MAKYSSPTYFHCTRSISLALGLLLTLTACGGSTPVEVVSTPPVISPVSSQTDRPDTAQLGSVTLSSLQAQNNLDMLASSVPVQPEQINAYNLSVKAAYDQWRAALAAERGPDWERLYLQQRQAEQLANCQSFSGDGSLSNQKSADTACAASIAANPPQFPPLERYLVSTVTGAADATHDNATDSTAYTTDSQGVQLAETSSSQGLAP